MKVYKKDTTLISSSDDGEINIGDTKTCYKIECEPEELKNQLSALPIKRSIDKLKSGMGIMFGIKLRESPIGSPITIDDDSSTQINFVLRDKDIIPVYEFLIDLFFMIQYDNKIENSRNIAFSIIMQAARDFDKFTSTSKIIKSTVKILKNYGVDFEFFKDEINNTISKYKNNPNIQTTMKLEDFLEYEILLSKLIHYKQLEYIRDIVGINLLKVYKKDILSIEKNSLSKTIKLCHSYKNKYPELYV